MSPLLDPKRRARPAPRGARPDGSSRADFLPTCRADLEARGWSEADVVFVTGDAYVDHPSFADGDPRPLARSTTASGSRSCRSPTGAAPTPGASSGRPRLFYAVSAGNMDSMINHYTANKKRRNDDAYSPGGRIGLRPDRADGRLRAALPRGVQGRAGDRGRRRGLAAPHRALRLLDRDACWPSILVTSQGRPARLRHGRRARSSRSRSASTRGEAIAALRDLRGVAYLLGRNETLPEHASTTRRATTRPSSCRASRRCATTSARSRDATRLLHHETNPLNARRLIQRARRPAAGA